MVAVGTNMSYDNAYYYLKPDNTVISILVILLFQASLLTTTKQAGIQLSLVFPCVSWQAQLSQGPPLHLADEATLVCHTCSCISSVISCGDSLNTSPISAIISLGIFWLFTSFFMSLATLIATWNNKQWNNAQRLVTQVRWVSWLFSSFLIWVILRCWGKSSMVCQQNSDAL